MADDSKRVLIVDDEKMIRDVVVKILNLKGHTPVEAENGRTALRILEDDSNFDYIILDLSMPGEMSGKKIFDLIREKYSTIEIIIATGYIDPSSREYFENNGVYDILEKPYKIDDIVEILV